jgi:hypothetical protein
MDLFSFDVFDTLITRRTALPTGIFGLVEERLNKDAVYADWPEFLKNNFARLRVSAESSVRMTHPEMEDVTVF